MTKDDIIRMAQEVGMQGMLTDVVTTIDEIERFASLVEERAAAAEREACAKVCDNYDIRAKTPDGWVILKEAQRVSSELATKIRARGEV